MVKLLKEKKYCIIRDRNGAYYMENPTLRIGFIILHPKYRCELEKTNGHRITALKWIRDNGLLELFYKVLNTENIYDEEDFLIEYIGAIKLYAYGGNFYCKMPRIYNSSKKYYKEFYESLGYKIIGDEFYLEEKPKTKVYKYQYNKTVINTIDNNLIYNPLKDGD